MQNRNKTALERNIVLGVSFALEQHPARENDYRDLFVLSLIVHFGHDPWPHEPLI